MRRHPAVSPLEAPWRDRLHAVARSRGWPVDPKRVGEGIAALSAAYNGGGRAPAELSPAEQSARLLFFFPRDAAKGAAAVRDLPAPAGRPLRILDLGAGLGATTLGALRTWGLPPAQITAVEADPDACAALPEVLAGLGELRVIRGTLDDALTGTWDLILFGQVLCELQRSRPAEERVATHAALLARARGLLAADGAVVVVEPALRVGTRHLQSVRDALAADGIQAFAPCTHGAPCPMLPRQGDWCHEWLDCPLPDWAEPYARAAGLRSEGLTLARLVLRADGAQPGGLRATSDVIATKGRRDVWTCGAFADGVAWRKVGRQDKHRTDANAGFDALHRGDRFAIDPLDPRIGPDSRVIG
jgi:SAM-dependent methyltransferase